MPAAVVAVDEGHHVLIRLRGRGAGSLVAKKCSGGGVWG